MSWHKYRAKNAKVKPLESVTELKVMRVNQSMIDNADYDPLSDYSDEEVNDSDLTKTVESVRCGLGCAGLEEPSYNLKQ